MEKFAKKDIEANRYKRILTRSKWTFSDKPLEGKLVGWKEGKPLFCIEAKSSTRIFSKEIDLFSKQDQQELLFYRDYNFQRIGKEKGDISVFELQPKKGFALK